MCWDCHVTVDWCQVTMSVCLFDFLTMVAKLTIGVLKVGQAILAFLLLLPGDLEEERAGVSRIEINENRIKHCTYLCCGHLRLLLG